MEVRPLQQSRYPLMHNPLPSQQIPLHHPQASPSPSSTPQPQRLQPFRQPSQQSEPLPQQSHFGLAPRPSPAFSGPRNPPYSAPSLTGHKRDSSGFAHGSSRSAETADGVNFLKLFVGSVPRNISEDEIRRLFGEYGQVLEVALLRDKRTGLQQGCCFIKYATVEEAERAIAALHNKRMLPGGSAPLQVKFADSERDRQVVAPAEQKLFVGSLNKQASEKEIEEIFLPFGRVDDVYIIRDEHKQSRGCAFVRFPFRDMAIRAMSALNGVYRMPGCDQPIIVRFADPKRPRSGENSRMGGPGFDGPSFSPHSHAGVSGPRAAAGSTIGARSPPFGWRGVGGPSGMGLVSQTGFRPLGTQMSHPVRGGTFDGSNPAVGAQLASGSSQPSPISSGQGGGLGMLPQVSQRQGYSESQLQRPMQAGQQVSMHQQPTQSFIQGISNQQQQQQQQPSTLQSQIVQSLQGFAPMQSLDARLQQQNPLGNYPSSQTNVHSYAQTQALNHQLPQISGAVQQPAAGLQSQQLQIQPSQQQGSQASQQPIELQIGQPLQQPHQQLLPVQQVAAQLHQFAGQTSSQQAQPAQSSQALIQAFQLASQPMVSSQPSWAVPVQQLGVTSNAATTVSSVPVTSAASAVLTCDWTEHTSPEGHKYYYNSSTGESRWEKPEEFAAFEQQQQQQQHQHQPYHQQQQQQQQQQQPAQQLSLQQQQQQQQQQQHTPQQLQIEQHQQQQQHPQPQAQQQQQAQAQSQAQQLQQSHQSHHDRMQQLPQQQIIQQPQLQQAHPAQQANQYHHEQQQQQHQLQQRQQQSQLPAYVVTSPQFTSLAGAAQQPAQGFTQLQATNGFVDPSRPGQQLATGHQVYGQVPPVNGILDSSRGAQQMSAMQQGLLLQDWMWKSKSSGS